MRSPQQRRRRWPDRAIPLLLALALAACGDDSGGGDTAATDSAGIAASKSKGPAGGGDGGTCVPPPVVPDSVLRGQWSTLLAWLGQEGVTFPTTPDNVAVGPASLFANTAPIQLQLRSTGQTYCLTEAQASERRIAGMMVLLQDFPGAGSLPPLSRGDSVFMFARGNPGAQQPATLVYRQGDTVAQFPGAAGWMFTYCVDGHQNNKPASQWRTRADSLVPPSSPGGGQGSTPNNAQASTAGGEGPGGGTYGWLACANGCCQFYTPPPTGGGDSIPPPPPFCVPRTGTGG